jgi:hypothetical protein
MVAIGSGTAALGEDVVTGPDHAGEPGKRFHAPLTLMQAPQYESVYAPPEPPDPQEGVNEGGVKLDLTVSYLTDYVLRGIDMGEFAASMGTNPPAPSSPDDDLGGSEDSPNLQVDGQVMFDLGKIPSPFFGVFVNVFDADPESRFQEIRPFFGLQLTARPITFAAGHNSYIYPDRDDLNTTEVFGKITVDDSYFFLTDDPILSPYVYAAYDYDLYDGLYAEAGVEHDFVFEPLGIVLTAQASIAYVTGHQLFALTEGGDDTGLQHYRLGLIGQYDLNNSLGIPLRYGKWNFNGYLFYVDGIENDLRAETQFFGGAGIGFSY